MRKRLDEPKQSSSLAPNKARPAISPDAKENQMIMLAMRLAESQLRDGTASSQVITHYLKLASSKEALEKKMLEKQNELLEAKTKQIREGGVTEKLVADALRAFSSYSGSATNKPINDLDNEGDNDGENI